MTFKFAANQEGPKKKRKDLIEKVIGLDYD
jgi:hypothetical protein